ncbi:TonB-dependent siderophore receptor [Methylobacillus pratensis]
MQPRFKLRAGVLALLCLSTGQLALAEDTLPEIQVKAEGASEPQVTETTKSYTTKTSTTATKLNTSLKETPQSISVITNSLINDFKLSSVNDVLDLATGIRVERAETDRTYYTARGSDITNFQIDGIGVPFQTGLLIGDMDSIIYDRIEVLRGANGLLTATGNPSATINFVRKRPTSDFQAKINLTVGSWDRRRIDADISGPLNEAGNVRGRLIMAHQKRNSYLDHYSQERNLAYGIIEADITDNTAVAFGHTYQQNNSNTPTWGALPLLYADGSKRHYSRSTMPAPDWTYWNTLNNTSFAELTHTFNNGWKIKTQFSRKTETGQSNLFYVMGNEDPNTGAGLIYYGGNYHDTFKEYVADIYASGPFSLAGREHELVVGSSWSRAYGRASGTGTGYIALSSFDSIATLPEPNWVGWSNFGSRSQKRLNHYAAAKFNLTENLKLTTGASMLTYKYEGDYYGGNNDAEAHDKVTPYAGIVYNLTGQHTLYASYTGIYNPQTALGANLQPLAPLEGKNYELGIKSDLLSNLNTSFALFKTVQENLAESTNQQIGNVYISRAIDATTWGYEFDMSGEVTDRLKVNGGYTRLMSVKGKNDENQKPYTPRHLIKLSTTYQVPHIEKLKVGASINWQDSTHYNYDNGTRYTQDSYAVINVMADYELDKHWTAAVNVYNLTNEKYVSSLMFGQSFYSAPMNASATLTWQY